MKPHKRTLIGSALVFLLGTSCCWLSALAVGIGGVSFLGFVIGWIESFQNQLIFLSVFLFGVSVFLYLNRRKENKEE